MRENYSVSRSAPTRSEISEPEGRKKAGRGSVEGPRKNEVGIKTEDKTIQNERNSLVLGFCPGKRNGVLLKKVSDSSCKIRE